MAAEQAISQRTSKWGRMAVEWGLLTLVIVVLIVVLGREIRQVRGQAERAAIQTTLGVLRTALVVEHLRQAVDAGRGAVAVAQRNPFQLLQSVPPNYAGEYGALELSGVAQGRWVFDADCACVGYQPMYPEWIDSPKDIGVLWFRISAPPGPLQISAQDRYVWQGQPLN